MFEKIIVPLDGSEDSEAAIEPAAEIARRFGSTVTLLQVTPGYGQVVGASAAESFGASGSVAAAAEAAVAAESAASSYLDSIRTKYGTPLWETVVGEGSLRPFSEFVLSFKPTKYVPAVGALKLTEIVPAVPFVEP